MLINEKDPFTLMANDVWVTSFGFVKGEKSMEIIPKDVDEVQPTPRRPKREKNDKITMII